MLRLRQHQEEAVESLFAKIKAGSKRILLIGDTGFGKTELATYAIQKFLEQGRQVTFFTDRLSILSGASDRFNKYDLSHAIVNGKVKPEDVDPSAPFHLVSVATLQRRSDVMDWMFRDIAIFDEAHESCWNNLIKQNWDRFKLVIGLTASPWRLKKSESMSVLFEDVVLTKLPSELIEMGYRVPYIYYCNSALPLDLLEPASNTFSGYKDKSVSLVVDTPNAIKQSIDVWEKYSNNWETIAFTSSINHSQNLTEGFKQRGHRAAHIDCNTPVEERKRLIGLLETGELTILSSCDTLSTGVDIPSLKCCLDIAPTRSRALDYQRKGRLSRNSDGKEYAIILDLVGNTQRHGTIDTLEWSDYDLNPPKKKKSGEAPIKVCPECDRVNHAAATECVECGYVFPLPDNKIELPVSLKRYGDLSPSNWVAPKDPDIQLYQRLKAHSFSRGSLPGRAVIEFKQDYDRRQKELISNGLTINTKRLPYPKTSDPLWDLGAVFKGKASEKNLSAYANYLKRCAKKKKDRGDNFDELKWIEKEMCKEFGANVALSYLEENKPMGVWQDVLNNLPTVQRTMYANGSYLEKIEGTNAIVRVKLKNIYPLLAKSQPKLNEAFKKVNNQMSVVLVM